MNILDQNLSMRDILSLLTKETTETKSMDFEPLLSLYLKLREYEIRKETKESYKVHMSYVFSFFRSMKINETKDLTQEAIDSFVKYSKFNNNKNITINKRLGVFVGILKYMSERNYITMPNVSYKNLKEQEAKITPVKFDDIQKIYDYLPNLKVSHQLILLLLIGTGIRRTELINIEVKNINFQAKSIYLTTTKSGKPRYIYFDKQIEELIIQQIENNNSKTNPFLFASGTTHIDKQSITSFLYKLKRDLKIDVLSSHKIRHFFATQLLRNGADIKTVKELLGHTKLEMTQRYIDFTNQEIKENNFKYNPLNNLKR